MCFKQKKFGSCYKKYNMKIISLGNSLHMKNKGFDISHLRNSVDNSIVNLAHYSVNNPIGDIVDFTIKDSICSSLEVDI